MTLRIVSADIGASGLPPTLTGTVTVGGVARTQAKAGELVTLTVVPAGTFTTVTFTVRSDAAPGVVLTGTGNTRTFKAPYLMALDDAMVDVVATGANGPSLPLTLGITVLPHGFWKPNAAGTAWVPASLRRM